MFSPQQIPLLSQDWKIYFQKVPKKNTQIICKYLTLKSVASYKTTIISRVKLKNISLLEIEHKICHFKCTM